MCPPPVATTSDNCLRICPIAQSITSCSQQVCSTSFMFLECDDDGKQAVWVGVLLISNNLLGLSLGYSAANVLVPQILAQEDTKTQLFAVNDDLMHHPVVKWSYYQTTSECLVVNPGSERRHSNKNCRFKVWKALFCADFRKLCWKVE